MNIETGEIKQFESQGDIKKFFDGMNIEDREKWIEIDCKEMTDKQKKTMTVFEQDHRSVLAKNRDIIRKQNRSARRKAKKIK